VTAQEWGARDVTVRAGQVTILNGVSLAVPRGQVTAVVGGDGAGKTTLLRCLAGALAADAGEVTTPGARRTGYLPAGSGTYPDLTVAENLAFRAAAYRLPPAAARARAAELTGRAGLAAARDRLAGQLSGGMRQKLGVICALLPEPDLLVLDEPSTGVDPVSRAGVWQLIAGAAAAGAAVVLSTTYLAEAQRAAAVLVLDGGAPVAAGTPEEVTAALPGRAEPGPPRPRPARPARPEPLAECVTVTRRFGPATAVREVSLAVRAGEIVGLLGANGAGKTTVIRMLLGLLPATAGTVALFGAAPSRGSRRRLGYVPQGLGLYDDLTVAENLSFSAAVFGAAPPGLPAELRSRAGVLVGALPLGLQRQAAFAQALAHRPDLLILDEPTSGMAPLGRARQWQAIHETAQDGAGILVTTHYMEEASECDRLVVLAGGQVVAGGTPAEVIGAATVTVVQAPAWRAAFRALESSGLAVSLAGSALRIPAATPAQVRAVLAPDPGSAVRITTAPATLEERFFELVQS
jgi:ABC-2 type transport system ATP-binding protein